MHDTGDPIALLRHAIAAEDRRLEELITLRLRGEAVDASSPALRAMSCLTGQLGLAVRGGN